MEFGIVEAARGVATETEERCFITELWNDSHDEAVSLARATVLPGVTTAWHVLSVDERYVVTQGSGRMEVGKHDARDIGSGDVVLIPAGIRQRVTNTGEGDLEFLGVCTPRFTSDCYSGIDTT